MAPKKKAEVQKLSYGEFMANDSFGGGSWADEVEESYENGTQPLPAPDRRTNSSYNSYGNDRGYSHREIVPQRIPDKPPYLAHLGNLDYEICEEDIRELLKGCEVTSIRLIEDRETKRPKGFGYAEFSQVEGLKQALDLDGTSFRGRTIKVKIADPPKGGDRGFDREITDWTRKGPLPDLPRGDRRSGPGDFSDRRSPRDNMGEERVRDFTWERKGPLSPLPQQDRPDAGRDGSRSRGLDGPSDRNRRSSPAAWGDARAPRREFAERPERAERVPTAAERDMQWRTSMRPDAPAARSPAQSRSGSEAPSSPAPAASAAGSRPRLHLAKRTITADASSDAGSAVHDAKSSPFGAARPINTAAREREIEDRRLAAQKEKKEADERAKEEHRKAKEAAAAAAAAAKVAEEEAKAKEEAAKVEVAKAAAEEKPAEGKSEEVAAAAAVTTPTTVTAKSGSPPAETPNGQKVAMRPKEEGTAAKTRAAESGNWRQSPGGHRNERGGGARRGGGVPRGLRHEGLRQPRANGGGGSSSGGPPSTPSTPKAVPEEGGEAKGPDEDGWETVPNKGRRNQKPRQ